MSLPPRHVQQQTVVSLAPSIIQFRHVPEVRRRDWILQIEQTPLIDVLRRRAWPRRRQPVLSSDTVSRNVLGGIELHGGPRVAQASSDIRGRGEHSRRDLMLNAEVPRVLSGRFQI